MTFTFEIIEKLVSSEKPDLIVITGDIVVSGSSKKDVDKLFKFMEQLQIPWAPVFGNHDGFLSPWLRVTTAIRTVASPVAR